MAAGTGKRFIYLKFITLVLLPCSSIFNCEKFTEKIITRTDTLTINIHDTTKIPVGTTFPTSLFGIIIDGLPSTNAIAPADSIYALLSLSSTPINKNAAVSFLGHPLNYTANQQMTSFFDGYLISSRLFNTITIARYDGFFRDTARTFACSARLPYYLYDTSTVLSYDTISDTVSRPGVIDSLFPFDAAGNPYDSIDPYTYGNPKAIKVNEDLKITWRNGAADWYAVECIKHNGISSIGDPLDTFSIDSQIVIPHSFFYQDSLTDSISRYAFLAVTVVPVNGPNPSTWDSCTSFEKRGYLFSMHYISLNPVIWLNAVPAGKNSAGLKKSKFHSPLESTANPLERILLKNFAR